MFFVLLYFLVNRVWVFRPILVLIMTQTFDIETFNVTSSIKLQKWSYLENQMSQLNVDILVTTETSSQTFYSNKNELINNFCPPETRGVGILSRGDIILNDITLHPSGRIIYVFLKEVLITGIYAKSGTQYRNQRHEVFFFDLATLLQKKFINILLLLPVLLLSHLVRNTNNFLKLSANRYLTLFLQK